MGAHTTGVPVWQAPPWQASPVVQPLPSSQALPSGLAGVEQAPVAGLQTPTSWQESMAVHTTGFWPVQAPLRQASVGVQALPSLQGVPSGLAGFEQAPVAGLQTPTSWQTSCAEQTTGLAPTQEPPWQVSLVVQAFPSLQAVPLGASPQVTGVTVLAE